MQSIIALWVIAAGFIAGGNAGRSPCTQRLGVFYDEVHSVSVRAPPGWCGSIEGTQVVFRPTSEAAGSTIHLVYETLRTTNRARAVGEALNAIEPSAHRQQIRSIQVAGVGAVRVFRLTIGGKSQLFVAAFAFHEELLIRVVGAGLPQNGSSDAPAEFRAVVQSVRAK
jgi:hypothetical protein